MSITDKRFSGKSKARRQSIAINSGRKRASSGSSRMKVWKATAKS